MVAVLFVCMGNICRSPTAHGVFEHMVAEAGLSEQIVVDSAGSGAWHIGEPPDQRAVAAAGSRGYRLEGLRARQVHPDDFNRFDYVLAMDRSNERHLLDLAPSACRQRVSLFLEFSQRSGDREVPDPYYGGEAGFDHVLDLVEDGARGLLNHICNKDLA